MSEHLSPVTQAVRAGLGSDEATGAVVPPIHLTSTFAFRCFGEKRAYDYTRSGNPTRDLLANAISDLEMGAGAVITATGMAAVTLVGYLIPVGARIVAPHDCYGGTYRLFEPPCMPRSPDRLRCCGSRPQAIRCCASPTSRSSPPWRGPAAH